MENHHYAVVSEQLAGENNTVNGTWMNNCSTPSPSAFFVLLSVRNRVNILFHGVCINYLFLSVKCTILNINVQIIYRLFDCNVVLLPFVVSLKVGSITGVTMSPGYGVYQTTTPPPPCYTTTFAPTGYYTEDHNYYTTKAPEYYTITKDSEYYTEASKHYTTKSPEYYTYVATAYTPRLPSITQFLATTLRLQLISPPKRLNRAAQVLHHQGG
jgi:hypothetical protein